MLSPATPAASSAAKMERTLFLVQRLLVYSATGCGRDRILIVATVSAGAVGFFIHKLNGLLHTA